MQNYNEKSIIFNKLVRDKIPEIIKLDNSNPVVRILDENEFKIELIKKLREEMKEFIKAVDEKEEAEKEIGDVYEVIDAIIETYNFDKDKIIEIKKERKEKRGGFAKKIFLEKAERL